MIWQHRELIVTYKRVLSAVYFEWELYCEDLFMVVFNTHTHTYQTLHFMIAIKSWLSDCSEDSLSLSPLLIYRLIYTCVYVFLVATFIYKRRCKDPLVLLFWIKILTPDLLVFFVISLLCLILHIPPSSFEKRTMLYSTPLL